MKVKRVALFFYDGYMEQVDRHGRGRVRRTKLDQGHFGNIMKQNLETLLSGHFYVSVSDLRRAFFKSIEVFITNKKDKVSIVQSGNENDICFQILEINNKKHPSKNF